MSLISTGHSNIMGITTSSSDFAMDGGSFKVLSRSLLTVNQKVQKSRQVIKAIMSSIQVFTLSGEVLAGLCDNLFGDLCKFLSLLLAFLVSGIGSVRFVLNPAAVWCQPAMLALSMVMAIFGIGMTELLSQKPTLKQLTPYSLLFQSIVAFSRLNTSAKYVYNRSIAGSDPQIL